MQELFSLSWLYRLATFAKITYMRELNQRPLSLDCLTWRFPWPKCHYHYSITIVPYRNNRNREGILLLAHRPRPWSVVIQPSLLHYLEMLERAKWIGFGAAIGIGQVKSTLERKPRIFGYKQFSALNERFKSRKLNKPRIFFQKCISARDRRKSALVGEGEDPFLVLWIPFVEVNKREGLPSVCS